MIIQFKFMAIHATNWNPHDYDNFPQEMFVSFVQPKIN